MTEAYKSLAIKIVLMVLTTIAGQLHLQYGATDMSAIATDAVDLGFLIYSLWRVNGMKLVPHASIALQPVSSMDIPAIGDHVPLGGGAAKVVGALVLAIFLSQFAQVDYADAQLKTPAQIRQDIRSAITPNASSVATTLDDITAQITKPFVDIANFIGEDATGAISLSTIVPSLQDGHGQQCWLAMKAFGDVIQAHPVPITFHVIQDYETLRLLGMATNNLCTNPHCTQVFADLTGMVTAASPVKVTIPSLHDLCASVPQIAVVAPVTVQ